MAMKIVYVDGFAIRNTLDPNFEAICRRQTKFTLPYPKFYIPENEIWIDNQFRQETEFLVKVDNFYYDPAYFEEIKNSKAQSNFVDQNRPYLQRFLLPGKTPSFRLKTQNKKGYKLVHVNGTIVRKHIDPEFVFGGHGLVYSYIPKGEIWVDDKMDQREIPYVALHEETERKLMLEGKIYDIAHDYATAAEKEARVKDGFGVYPDYESYPWRGLSNKEVVEKYYVVK